MLILMKKKAKGLSGQIEISEEGIAIKRRGISSIFHLIGLLDEKKFSLSEISSVYFKLAGNFNGFIRFSVEESAKPKFGLFNTIFDSNTVSFRKKNNEKFENLLEHLASKNIEINSKDAFAGEKAKAIVQKNTKKLEKYSNSQNSESNESENRKSKSVNDRHIKTESTKSTVILTDNKLKIKRNNTLGDLVGEKYEINIDNLQKVDLEAKSRNNEYMISLKFKKKSSKFSSIFKTTNIRTVWEKESNYEQIIEQLEKEDIEVTRSGMSAIRDIEIKRTCKECGNIWHIQEDEIQRLKRTKKNNKIVGGLTALSGQLATSAQVNRNKEAAEEQLKKLERCPKCRSRNYEEETIEIE